MSRICASISRMATGLLHRGREKRVVVLLGAGASVEYKAPSTAGLTQAIERVVTTDKWTKHTGADAAFATIKSGLQRYLSEPPNFEQIYHIAHELLSMAAPTPGAADEFRPLLYPFMPNNTGISRDALRALVDKMAEAIYAEVSASCANNPLSLGPLTNFISSLRASYITRIYTTNYDDFLLQAAPDLYTGFNASPSAAPKRFELDIFGNSRDRHAALYLHGSVHMGFAAPGPASDIGELLWFDDRKEALKHSSFTGSGIRQMDGTEFSRTAVITGLDKLSRLQQRPLSHFYSALADDLMRTDVIFVIGSGLADLHFNTWLKEARSRRPQPPILFVDWWEHGFLSTISGLGRKEIEMFHALGIHIASSQDAADLGNGWILANDGSAAIWEKGFQAFLNDPGALKNVLGKLGQ